MIIRKLYYSLSPGMRRVARRLVYFPVDLFDGILGRREAMVPPKGMIFTGSGDFVKSGDALMQLCIEHGMLQPDGAVLDVGCGIGRLARPLTAYLSSKGRYEGFDVVPDGVNWCKQNITTRFANFNFTYVPLRNDLYNLSTQEQASSFIFPYADNSFNLVVLTSVFTHMQYNDVQHYLKQIKRVLKPGGVCLATFFVIDEQTQNSIANRTDVMQFNFEYDTYYLHDQQVKDANIAFKYSALQNMAEQASLKLTHWHQGWWRGTDKKAALNYQDVVIFIA